MSLITIFKHRAIPAAEYRSGRVTDCSELSYTYSSDVHFGQYASPVARRLVKADVGQIPITVETLAIDLDGPDHQAGPAWRLATRCAVAEAFRALGPGYYYETRGGGRILWAIEPFEVRSLQDAADWEASYLEFCAKLKPFGLEADQACAKWLQLFRAPNVTRERAKGAERAPFTLGELEPLGCVEFELYEGTAEEPSTPHIPPVVICNEDSIFKRLCVNANLIQRPIDSSTWIIECPNEGEHSVPSDGTRLFDSGFGGLGRIHCFHRSCGGRYTTAEAWLHAFTFDELAAVGIERAYVVAHCVRDGVARLDLRLRSKRVITCFRREGLPGYKLRKRDILIELNDQTVRNLFE